MSGVELPVVRYRLGAEELIELGRSRRGAPPAREPFLAGRPRGARRFAVNALGQMADRTGPFITGALNRAVAFLCGMTELPGGILSSPMDAAAAASARLFANVPGTADVAAQVLVLGSAAVKFGVALPDPAALGRLMAALSSALSSRLGAEGRAALVEDAKVDVVRQAPVDLKADVMRALDATTAEPPEIGAAGGPVLVGKTA